MKLITVVGATPVSSKQQYLIDGTPYEEYFAFLAATHSLGISHENIIVIGTEQTKALLSQPQYAIHPSILENFVFSGENIDELFEKCLALVDDDTVLELTQGFRHLPMTLLLSGIAASSEKRLSNILYAKTSNPSCNPIKEICSFEFVSLVSYLDRANLNAIIHNFCTSYVVPKLRVSLREFIPLEVKLTELSRHLLGNNLDQSIQIAVLIRSLIHSLDHSAIANSISELKPHIDALSDLSSKHESLRLYQGAKLFYSKELLLHSVTNLFEAVSALMDEKVHTENLYFTYFDHKEKKTKHCKEHTRPYNRRNCLKKGLKFFLNKNKTHPVFNNLFLSKLQKLDEMRNHSAHAHATEKAVHEYRREIGEMFIYFDRIFKV